MLCKHGCRNFFYYFLIRVFLGLPLVPKASVALDVEVLTCISTNSPLSNIVRTSRILCRELKETAFHIDIYYLTGRADIL